MKVIKTLQHNKSLALFIGSILIINFIFFSPIYFFNKYIIDLDSPIKLCLFLLPYLIVCFLFWIRKPLGVIKKTIIILLTAFFTAFTGFVMMLSTMVLPGSKEHNH